MAFSIVELIPEDISLLYTFILLQGWEGIIDGFAGLYAFFVDRFSELMVIDISPLVHFKVVHKINLTIALNTV